LLIFKKNAGKDNMAIFLLIRHGDNDVLGKTLSGRLPGVHLNENGQAQAHRLAEELSGVPLKAVYASPLERTIETAAPIAEAHELTVEILTALNEVDFGEWEGQSLESLKQVNAWETVQKRPGEIQFPGGESLVEAQKRATDQLIILGEQYAENDLVVCVSHSDIIRLTIAYFLGVPWDRFQRIRVDPASITALYLFQGNTHFGPINQTFGALQFYEK
jgi:probable phosphoglycerate mutase